MQLFYPPQCICCSCKWLLSKNIYFQVLLNFNMFCVVDQKANTLGDQKDCAMPAFVEPPDLLGRNLTGLTKLSFIIFECWQCPEWLREGQSVLGLGEFPTGSFCLIVNDEMVFCSLELCCKNIPLPQCCSNHAQTIRWWFRTEWDGFMASESYLHSGYVYTISRLPLFFSLKSTNISNLCMLLQH